MIVFIVLINNHKTAFYTWHVYGCEKYVSCEKYELTHIFFGTIIIMPSIECSIVIIDQYHENNHDLLL